MTRMQRWLLIAGAVIVAAFVTGLVQGMTGTVPPDLRPSPAASQSG